VDVVKQFITPHKEKGGKQIYPLPLSGTNGFKMSYSILTVAKARSKYPTASFIQMARWIPEEW
jgi:hypothetical protein